MTNLYRSHALWMKNKSWSVPDKNHVLYDQMWHDLYWLMTSDFPCQIKKLKKTWYFNRHYFGRLRHHVTKLHHQDICVSTAQTAECNQHCMYSWQCHPHCMHSGQEPWYYYCSHLGWDTTSLKYKILKENIKCTCYGPKELFNWGLISDIDSQ